MTPWATARLANSNSTQPLLAIAISTTWKISDMNQVQQLNCSPLLLLGRTPSPQTTAEQEGLHFRLNLLITWSTLMRHPPLSFHLTQGG